jgi:hypothetical protein
MVCMRTTIDRFEERRLLKSAQVRIHPSRKPKPSPLSDEERKSVEQAIWNREAVKRRLSDGKWLSRAKVVRRTGLDRDTVLLCWEDEPRAAGTAARV